jgi:CheY-like chemotaxis protein
MNEDALILIVEDDDYDALLFQDAFRRAGIPNPFKILLNGDEGIDYLSGTGPFEAQDDLPAPGLSFIDLHRPVTGGLEFVRWLKSEPSLSEVPVIVMTDSDDRDTLKEAYDAGANLAFCKPAEGDKFVEAVRLCCEHLLIT